MYLASKPGNELPWLAGTVTEKSTIVIVRYPTSLPNPTTSVTPTVVGSYRYYKFTSSGSITF